MKIKKKTIWWIIGIVSIVISLVILGIIFIPIFKNYPILEYLVYISPLLLTLSVFIITIILNKEDKD